MVGESHPTTNVIGCMDYSKLKSFPSQIQIFTKITADTASYPGVAKVNMLSLSLGQQTKE